MGPDARSPRREEDAPRQWLRATAAEDEAALKIQSFLRDKLRLTASTASSSSSLPDAADALADGGAADDADDSADDSADAHWQYELLLWHGSSLGALAFAPCARSGLPRVVSAAGNAALPGMCHVREGDRLLSVNGRSAHAAATPFASVLRVLESGERPAVLRLRRPLARELPRTAADRPGPSRRRQSLDARQARARVERALCHVVWREEDGPLGVQLRPQPGRPFPVVSEVHAAGLAGRAAPHARLREGDELLAVNHYDVAQLGYARTVQVMQCAPRPLALTFRRRSPPPAAACCDL